MEKLHLFKLGIVWESAQVKTIEDQIIFPQGRQSCPQTVKCQPLCKLYEDIFKAPTPPHPTPTGEMSTL